MTDMVFGKNAQDWNSKRSTCCLSCGKKLAGTSSRHNQIFFDFCSVRCRRDYAYPGGSAQVSREIINLSRNLRYKNNDSYREQRKRASSDYYHNHLVSEGPTPSPSQ